MKDEIEPNTIFEKFKDKEIYFEMMQVIFPAGEIANSELIKKLLGMYYVINPISNYIRGNYTKSTALKLFLMEAGAMLERFSGIKNFAERLFVELVNILETIGNIQTQSSQKVEKVMEEMSTIKIGQTVKLKKEKPITIRECDHLKITIERDGEAKNHILNIERNNGKLTVWCSTADSEEGRKLIIEIEADEEYAIGQADTRMLDITKAKLAKAIENLNEATNKFKIHNRISSISQETQTAEKRAARAKSNVEILEMEIKKLESDPRFKWFDQEKSSDISSDHIIIKYTEEGTIKVTDEGDKCKASLMRLR